jgi:dTDP-4-amino-4,6-dideoxygalactose transaminase
MPVSERVSQQIFSLPMHPNLLNDDIERVVAAIVEAV